MQFQRLPGTLSLGKYQTIHLNKINEYDQFESILCNFLFKDQTCLLFKSRHVYIQLKKKPKQKTSATRGSIIDEKYHFQATLDEEDIVRKYWAKYTVNNDNNILIYIQSDIKLS